MRGKQRQNFWKTIPVTALPENCSVTSINSGWSVNKDTGNRCFRYCLEATPHNDEGIFDAGEAAISNARIVLDDSYAHRGEMAQLLLGNFDSDEDSDVEVVVFAKNEII